MDVTSLFYQFTQLVFKVESAVVAKEYSFWEMIQPPIDISTTGHYVTSIFDYTTYLNIFYFILVCGGIFGFSFLYHRKRHPKPYYTHGNKKVHLLVTAFMGAAVFLSIDLNITRMSNDHITSIFWNWPDAKKEDVVRIQVQGQQWVWNFRYHGEDGEFNTADDIVTTNELYIPEGKKIMFQITSKDVIHSFYLPNFRTKVDAIPGRITRLWFEAKTGYAGTYDIACAEMCGTHHYLMKAEVIVQTQNDFIAWQKYAQQTAYAANDPEDANFFWGWKWEI